MRGGIFCKIVTVNCEISFRPEQLMILFKLSLTITLAPLQLAVFHNPALAFSPTLNVSRANYRLMPEDEIIRRTSALGIDFVGLPN
jgi:hypothetical protein